MCEMEWGSAFNGKLTQICGHSRLNEVGTFVQKDNFYMCDSRAIFIWDGKELKVWDS